MAAGASTLAMMAVFSGLSMNLVLQFGLGLKELVAEEHSEAAKKAGTKVVLAGLGILFLSIVFLWLFFSLFRSLPVGLVEYMLLFPASYLLFSALEYLANRFAAIQSIKDIFVFWNVLRSTALVTAALFITLNVAGTLAEAAVLSLGFTAGVALAVAIAGEIRRRSQMEAVPRFLRGGPLALVSLGLLSLVFSSTALMFFEVLGAR